MNATDIQALVTRLAAASYAYHNGLPLQMTDAEFDAGVDALRAVAPDHPFLLQVGAPVLTGDEVDLPIPLPSLNKIKPDGSLEKWLGRWPAPSYHLSAKLDGCSALWLPASRQLFTRGDGMRGRNISTFHRYFQGLVVPPATAGIGAVRGDLGKPATPVQPFAVRGELIMRTDSPAIPAGKLARNIVAGALNRKEPDPTLFAEIRFVAYELIQPADKSPEDAGKLLRTLGFEMARATVVAPEKMTTESLSAIFTKAEEKSPYQMDGLVVAPNVARPASWTAEVRKGAAVNPADRVAWKTRLVANTATTTVRTVEWNVSAGGVIIPRVLFDTVQLSGANIGAATGLHARWIVENSVGPGATIEVRRAGDVIPQIVAVHMAAPAGPAMPPEGTWAWDGELTTAIHIRPVGGHAVAEAECASLTRALRELGAENVGPGIVEKLYAAGFRTIGQIFAASPADFAARVAGFKGAAAQRTYDGLRAGQAAGKWTELNRMVASGVFGRGIGHSKLQPLLALEPDLTQWSVARFTVTRPAGLSAATTQSIVAAVPAYLEWVAANPLGAPVAAPVAPPATAAMTQQPTGPRMVIVLTGFRDKALEAALLAAGHTTADSVSKKVTHVVHPDGPTPSSTKITKAQELGITILTVSELRARL
jgi:NAD-dependent DNA ligase